MTTQAATFWPEHAEPIAEELTPAWFEARLSGIGASEAPGLIGVGLPDPLSLYARKLQLVPEPEPGAAANERMYWGRELQGRLLQELGKRAGVQVEPNRWLYRSRVERWQLATPDGAVLNDDGTVDVAEIKTTGGHLADDWAGGVPFRVKVQTAQQLGVTGAARAFVGCLIGGQTFVWDVLTRDELAPVVELVRTSGREFWRRVEAREQPPATANSLDVLARLYPDATEREVELTAYEDVVRRYLLAREKIRGGEIERDTCKAALVQAMGDASVGFVPGVGRFTYKQVSKAGYTVGPKQYRELRFYGEAAK